MSKTEYLGFISENFMFDDQARIAVQVEWRGEYEITKAWFIKNECSLRNYPFRRGKKDWDKVHELLDQLQNADN